METPTENRAHEQAAAQYAAIKDMVARYDHARTCTDAPCEACNQYGADCPTGDAAYCEHSKEYHDEDDALQTIQDDPLSVEVRSGWYGAGQLDPEPPAEFRILLCTGGPAVRMTGTLGDSGDPDSAQLEYQDWFTPWVEYRVDEVDEEVLLEYAQCFHFGDA